ncbi:hypothetical protein D3C71_1862070 [compost metagenome]
MQSASLVYSPHAHGGDHGGYVRDGDDCDLDDDREYGRDCGGHDDRHGHAHMRVVSLNRDDAWRSLPSCSLRKSYPMD